MTTTVQKTINVFILMLVTSWIALPCFADDDIPDSLITWGPVLGMFDNRPFVSFRSEIPLSVELAVLGYPSVKESTDPEGGVVLALPEDLKGQFDYQVVLQDDNDRSLELGPYHARLPGEPGRDLVVVIYGDTRDVSQTHYDIVEQILKNDPDVVLNTGDVVHHGEWLSDWQQFSRISGSLLARRIMLPCLGNHDDHSEYYYKFFNLPGNGRWYEWSQGPMRLISLDSDIDDEIEEGEPDHQTPWFSEVLSKPEPPKTFTVVMFHHPIFTSGNYDPWEYGMNHWVPLITDNAVDIVFNGHNHMYERAEYQGIPFITAAGGGARLYRPKDLMPETIYIESVHHFVLMTFNGSTLTGKAIRYDGEIIDTWEYPIR